MLLWQVEGVVVDMGVVRVVVVFAVSGVVASGPW